MTVGHRIRQTRLTEALPPAALHAMARIEQAFAKAERELAAKVGQAIGLRPGWQPRGSLGETPTVIYQWTQRELNDVFERVGGTVTARKVERSTSAGTWPATEITLTTEVPGVGPVRVVTDWDEESGGHDLPVMHGLVLPSQAVTA
jgi:hypothetical protein